MEKTYAYHKPSDDGAEKIQQVRELFSALHGKLKELCPSSMELNEALKRLKESSMWATSSIVLYDPGSTVVQ